MDKAEEKSQKAHEILHEFRCNLQDIWVSQSWINKHDRLWISVFNELVSQGLIEKKKSRGQFAYRWKAVMPF
ncbi:MAG: hypothetical protein ACE5DM_01870 [Candidatus Nanoarchaeia archaeon]